MSTGRDVVAIVGTTGTGKSQLAVELALSLQDTAGAKYWAGEVINADSMQVYKGLDVLTNKAPEPEMKGVPHHLMSFLNIDEDYFVERFRHDALRKIEEIHDRGNLPIVVGGTSYYVQNLLLPGNLVRDVAGDLPGAGKSLDRGLACTPDQLTELTSSDVLSRYPEDLQAALCSLPPPLLYIILLLPSLPPISSAAAFAPDFPIHLLPSPYKPPKASAEDLAAALHAALRTLDPDVAARWHWRDLRKVRRSLEVVICTGKRMSEVIAEQEGRRSAEQSTVPYRSLIFWLYAAPDLLNPRLDARVDKMAETGLLDEVKQLRAQRAMLQIASRNDFSRGPYQSIGYRELDAYLSSPPATSEPDGRRQLEAALDLMKTSTRQYAKHQVKWMKSKFAPAVAQAWCHPTSEGDERSRVVELFLLDASNVDQWSSNVGNRAQTCLNDFIARQPLPQAAELNDAARTLLAPALSAPFLTLADRAMRKCEVCTIDAERPFMLVAEHWEQHVKSTKHRNRARRLKDPRAYRCEERVTDKTADA